MIRKSLSENLWENPRKERTKNRKRPGTNFRGDYGKPFSKEKNRKGK